MSEKTELAIKWKHRRFEEDRLQMACRYWFDVQYPNFKLLLHHSPNEGVLGSNSAGAKRKAMGVRAGFPDFILLCSDHGDYNYLSIELKTAKGKQSPAQKEYERAIYNRGGGKYVIVRSLDEFKAVIDDWLKVDKFMGLEKPWEDC